MYQGLWYSHFPWIIIVWLFISKRSPLLITYFCTAENTIDTHKHQERRLRNSMISLDNPYVPKQVNIHPLATAQHQVRPKASRHSLWLYVWIYTVAKHGGKSRYGAFSKFQPFFIIPLPSLDPINTFTFFLETPNWCGKLNRGCNLVTSTDLC